MNIVSAAEAVSHVSSGDRVFFQGAAMTPKVLIEALVDRYKEIKDIEIFHIHTEGPARYTQSPYRESFCLNSAFAAGNVRDAVNAEYGAYIPIFLSEIHLLFRRN